MKAIRSRIATALLGTAMLATLPATAQQLYSLDSATALPSTDTDWDYIKLEPHGTRLFMARRKDGLTVFDTHTKKVIGTVANSTGANGPLLLPQFNRGYVAMTDGTLLSFDLKSLAVIDRIKLADDGGLNGAVYEPTTKRVQVVVGSRPETSHWYSIDAATGKVLGKKAFPFRKMDDPAPDGKGNLYAPARYDNVILKLKASDLSEQARFTVGDCVQPVALEYQAATNRLLLGCRGDKPLFLAIDPDNGRILTQIPIGKGIDGMAVDEKRHRIITSGGDSSMSVIAQDGPDSYRLLGNLATRPMARIMQIDEEDGALYLVTANHTVGPATEKGAGPVTYHKDSFTVLAYKPVE